MIAELRVSITVIVIMSFAQQVGGNDLWCYECNTELKGGHRGECNDPYTPGTSTNLVACSQNESHHCLKSVILYRNVLVTVRACVPSREIDGYCRHEEYFPRSSIECFFCKDYACNGHGSFSMHTARNLALFVFTLIFVSKQLTS